jgi:endonuclease YncB( thermonuclease family)
LIELFRKKWWLGALGVSLLLNVYFLGRQYLPFGIGKFGKSGSESFSGRVVRVIDGDTLDLEAGRRIRLLGIDAPEYPKGCLADRAKERLTALVMGREVRLGEARRGNLGREAAYVYVGDSLVEEILVEEGLAKAGRRRERYRGSQDAKILAAEDRAKAAKRGIWSKACQPVVDPNCRIKGNVRRENGAYIYVL